MESENRLKFISHKEKTDVLVKPPEPYKSFYSY